MNYQDKFAEMLRKSRADSGLSQKEVAKRLGISRTTVQNWESGYSCPTQLEGFLWFRALGLQPLPYYLGILYPEFEQIDHTADDDHVEAALLRLISGLPIEAKKKLLYCAYGNHGSNPLAVLELVTAHLQTPLRARLSVAEVIRSHYEVAQAVGTLAQPEYIHPNIDLLNSAYLQGKAAVMRGEQGYTIMEE